MSVATAQGFGFVSESASLTQADLDAIVQDALKPQINSDLRSEWSHRGYDLQTFAKRADVPAGYIPAIVQDALDDPNALGYHTDELNQPVIYVEMTDTVSVTLSHETLETVCDPSGNHLYRMPDPDDPSKVVLSLLELCDPCERITYQRGGIDVSDFIAHDYGWGPMPGKRFKGSHTGAIAEPRQILDGGYISFVDPVTLDWEQITNFGQRQRRVLGHFNAKSGMTLREWVDQHSQEARRYIG